MMNIRNTFLFAGLIGLALTIAGCDQPTQRDQAQHKQQQRIVRSLPYAKWAPVHEQDLSRTGVVRFVQEKACSGYNLFCPRHLSEATLTDMQGQPVFHWSHDSARNMTWQHVWPLEQAGLLVLVKDWMLIRLDKASNLKWVYPTRYHHEAFATSDGTIVAASRTEEMAVLNGREFPVLGDAVTMLSPDGEHLKTISLTPLFKDAISPQSIDELDLWLTTNALSRTRAALFNLRFYPDTPPDILHLNSIQVLDRDIPGFCKQGQLLVSIREIDTIAVIDTLSCKVVWRWGPDELQKQHHARLLDNGHVLTFDNGQERGESRIVELDPKEKRIVWQYTGSDADPFFSPTRGACERLPNGNTLITESDNGRVFEVTPDAEIVWEYFSPHITTNRVGHVMRAALYRVFRIMDPQAYGIDTP